MCLVTFLLISISYSYFIIGVKYLFDLFILLVITFLKPLVLDDFEKFELSLLLLF